MNVHGAGFGQVRRDAARPVYQQIKDVILERIGSGEWLPGARLPSEHALVEELGVSRMTVNRALRELTQVGHLTRVHGVGTFVAEAGAHGSLLELKNIADEIAASGRCHRAETVRRERVRTNQETADRLQMETNREVYHVVMVHYRDDLPIQLEDRLVNPALAPGFAQVDLTRTTPTQYLMSLFRPDEIEHVVQAVMPSPFVSEALAIPATEPCLRLNRRTWKNRQVVTSASLYYPSSRYDLAARYATDRIDEIFKRSQT